MRDLLQPRSPLAEFFAASNQSKQPAKPGVELSEMPFLEYLNLRGEPADPGFLKGVERCLGIPVPVRPNTFAANGRVTILWLGPNEWLVITLPGNEAEVAHELHAALEGVFSAVTDITHSQTVIRLRGDRALDVLRKGCSLDLHPAVFGPGCCAQTLLAKAGVVIRWVDHTPAFDLIVRRSFAEYLALWLKDAAQEYGLALTQDVSKSQTELPARGGESVRRMSD